ncbi:DNA repair protein RadA [Alkalibacillus almallahensis]|uniref:DNA repair protein RadA n=1 Tax=Alkalibacillus almallahensis TaxID=1379154 RepID=UPI00141E4A69|nr:DNA repair protein RadA [Alkalibacillus almallahensis]NIK12907.1 DNA repair protein RadA/Sms [Alkalibacillus almallahensis]
MAKSKVIFFCQECGYESPKWMGKCPACHQWNTLVEEKVSKNADRHEVNGESSKQRKKPQSIKEVSSQEEERLSTQMEELNRVLGGGIVPGSLVLIGGDPGIGKSTLLLQLSSQVANNHMNVLYISGEESEKQTKLRSDRLDANEDHLYIMAETNLEYVIDAIDQMNPSFVVIDSIQTIFNDAVTSAPGSVSQVRECTSALMKVAKSKGISIFIVGHVTKEGAIAGPRLLEHMVDTVLYFEGERHHTFRILRSVKNRFGSTHEMGIFEMKEEGLKEVSNPSEIFLEERSQGVAGSTVVCSLEGTRPMLVEIQALISPTQFGNSRRMATGLDHNRVPLLMAVLEKRAGLLLQNQDAYVKVAGGVKLDEPAIDLAVAISVSSSFRDQPTRPDDVYIGEVGLTGEVRRVARIEQRVHEAHKLGFKRIILPSNNLGSFTPPEGIELVGVNSVQEALKAGLE